MDDPEISIRLKYGIHTIFLFAMPDWPFSRLTTELLSILRDRYPNGLTPSIAQPDATPVPPNDGDVNIAYALPKNQHNLSGGWKNLKAQPGDTLGQKGLTDMCSVAFALLDSGTDVADAEFQVEVAELEDDEEAAL